MAVHYRTQGFVLSKDNLREADQVFNIYTKDFGKLKILGRAIRKIKSKLRFGTELFYLSEVEFIQGRNYKTLTDAVLIDKFKNIRGDLDKLENAYKISELADSLIKGQEPDQEIFDLLNDSFNKLNDHQFSSQLFYHYFLWNLLSFLGYQIDLYNCVFCQSKLVPKNLYFNPNENGIICSQCISKVKQAEAISPEVIKIVRIFLKKDWPTLLRLKISESHRKELESVSEKYFCCLKENINML